LSKKMEMALGALSGEYFEEYVDQCMKMDSG
jgi:hypothetical protein